MKMDDKYFEQKLFLFNRAMFCEYIPILKRIAHDQREADVKKVQSLYVQYPEIDSCDEMKCPLCALDKVVAALREEDK